MPGAEKDNERMHTEQALREARALFADVAPPEVLLSEELIADRRAEVARD